VSRSLGIRGAKTTVFLFSLILVASGCSTSPRAVRSQAGSIASVVRADQDYLEVAATTEDQARNEVLLAPTTFEVPFADDVHSWERARFFLENYVSGASGRTSAVTKVVGVEWSLESNPAVTNYRYIVSKHALEGSFAYRVACVTGPGGEPSQAALNAGNFARFIRDGKLEVSLLQRQ
jgi:hypothetical protein